MAAIKPVLDRQAASVKILGVIKQIDHDVEEVMDTAAHVALYDFDVADSKWARKDVEGALYVVKRKSQPRFRCIVLNKKGSEDFMEDIGPGFVPELQSPYLLYRANMNDPDCKVIGIWFFEAEDCTRITELLQRISKLVTPGQDRILPEPSSATKTGSNYEPGLRRTGSDGNGPAPAPAPAPAAAAKEPAPSDRARLSQIFANLKVQKAPGQEQPPPEPAPEPVESKPKPATAAPQLLNPALLLRGAPLAAGVPASGVSGKALAPKQSARPSPNADTVAVQELFKRLATNEKLCAEFAKELRSSGLLK